MPGKGSQMTPSNPRSASSKPQSASSTPKAVAASTPTPASSIKVTKDTIDGILKPQLNPQQDKLYEFCKNILLNYKAEFDDGTEDRTLFEIFIDIYQNYYPINNNMTDKEINIFLNFLRVYNSPTHKRVYNSPTHKRVSKPNIVKYFKTKTENQYADLLFKQKNMNSIPGDPDLNIDDLGTTLLFKFVNQIAYETTCLNERRRFGNMNFIKVDGGNHLEKIKGVLASTIFEEIVLWAISGGITYTSNMGTQSTIPEPICSIHCPWAGDILMDDGKSVEVKSTTDDETAKTLFKESQDKAPVGVRLSFGVHGRRCRPTAGQINVCLNAYELPTTAVSKEIEITKDFTTEQTRFEGAFDFAIRNSGIETVKPVDYTVQYLLENHYSNIVLYHTPSSMGSRISLRRGTASSGAPAGKGPVAPRLGMGHSLAPSFLGPPGKGKTLTTTKKVRAVYQSKVRRAPPGLGSRPHPGLGRAPPGLGSAASQIRGSTSSKTSMGSAATIFTGVVIESFPHPKSGAAAGKLIRDSDGKEINFIGDFKKNTKVKFRVRFDTAIKLEIISSPTVKGKNKKSKKRRKNKRKTKKK